MKTGSCAGFLAGFAVMGLIAAILTGKILKPPAWVVAVALVLLAAIPIRLLGRFMAQRQERAQLEKLSEGARSIAPQIAGDYSPYVVEAVDVLASEEAATPLLLARLARLVQEKTPGWEEMAGAIATGVACNGNKHALSTLRKLVRISGTIPEMAVAVESLEQRLQLLRPALEPQEGYLLRPAQGASTDSSVLLRPENRPDPETVLKVDL